MPISSRTLKSHFAKSTLLATGMAIILSSCTGSGGPPVDPEKEQLRQRISALEAENSGLKAQVETMRQAVEAVPSKESDKAQDAVIGSSGQSAASSKLEQTAPKAAQFMDLTDVPTKEMIDDLAKLGIFDEMGADFKPYQPITRGEYVTWLYKAYNALEPESKQIRLVPQLTPQFKDTPPTHPAYKYVQALANAGYSIGYKDGTFRPDKPLTREEMLGIKVGLDVGKTLDPWRSQMEAVWKFGDSKEVDERFTGYIHQDYYVSGPHGSNIQRAFGKIGKFKPKEPVLRSEAAASLWQMGQFGDTHPINAAAALKQQ